MADENMKMNVEVKTSADSSGISQIETKIKALDTRLKNLGKTGASKGLEAAMASNAKAIEKVNKAFKVSDALVERVERKLMDTAKAGKLTSAVVGTMTREINKMGRSIEKIVDLNRKDADVYAQKIARGRAMLNVIQRVATLQEEGAKKMLALQGEIDERRGRIAKAQEAAAARARAETDRTAAAARRMAATDERTLVQKGQLERQLENDRERARENERRHERALDQTRRRREAMIARAERAARNMMNARTDNRIGAGNLLDSVQTQSSRLGTRLSYRGPIERGLGSEAIGGYRNAVAGALRRYRTDIAALKSQGDYDPKAETRILKRLRTERQGAYGVFQEKMTFAREEQRVADRNERDRLRAIREQERAYQRLKSQGLQGYNEIRSNGSQLLGAARQPAMVGAIAAAAAMAASAKAIAGKMTVDTAETNLQIFGSEPASRKGPGSQISKEDVRRDRREWLDQAALDNGINASTGLNAYTEVIKAGVTGDKAKSMTKLLMSAGSGMDMPLDEITRVMGKIAQNVPGVDEARMKNILNSMAISAATTASDPNQIVAGMRRGMGVFSMSNMSPETLAAYTSVGAGAGVQEGKTGNFIAELVSTVMTAGKQRGQRKKDLNVAARSLGFGSAQGLSMAGSIDTDAAIDKLLGNFSRLSKAQQALMAQKLGGREWDDEIMQFVNSIDKLRDVKSAINDPRNKNFLDDAQAKRMASWHGKWNKAKAVMSLAWESIGTGFDEVYNQALDYFASSGSKFDFGQITRNVEGFLKGFVRGLGFEDVRGLLTSVFGNPGSQQLDYVRQLQGFGRGLAQGFRSVFEGVKGLMSAFTGGSQDPEVIGRLTGKIVALSASLVLLSPVITVLGALASTIGLIVGAVKGLSALGGLLGFSQAAGVGAGIGAGAGTAGAAASGGLIARMGMSGLATRLLGGLGLALVAEIGANRGSIATLLGAPEIGPMIWAGFNDFFASIGTTIKKALSIKGIVGILKAAGSEAIPAPLQRWYEGEGDDKPALTPQRDVTTQGNQRVIDDSFRKIEELKKQLEPNTRAVEENTKVQKQSFDQGTGLKGLIKPASFSNSSSSDVQSFGARLQLAALSSGSGSVIRALTGGAGGAAAGLGEIRGSGSPTSLYGATPGQALPNTGSGFRSGMGGEGATAPSGSAAQTFGQKAPGIMDRLQKDLGLSKEQAAGILGNLGHESAGFTAYGENGGKGPGVGWAQWTDPGRKARFLEYAQKNGLNPRSDEASYGFLKWELQNTHKNALANLKKETTVEGATRQFEKDFEGAGVKHMDRRLGYARQAMGMGGGGSGDPASSGSSGSAVDNAAKLLGAGSSQAAQALGSKMTPGQWCADFVNGALKSAGVKGVNSSIANSFQTWGDQVTGEIKKGDVVVTHRGHGPGQSGGHVGLATGETRVDPRTGRLQYQTVSGNHGNAVGKGWEDADKVMVRRAQESMGGKPGAFNPRGADGEGNKGTASGRRADRSSPEDLAKLSPAEKLAQAAPPMPRGGSGAGGGRGPHMPPTFNIHQAGNAEETANAVQRRIQDTSNYLTHDLSFESV